MRSSQLDASRLDEELSLMLREQFLSAFSFFPKARSAGMRAGGCMGVREGAWAWAGEGTPAGG